MHSSNNLTPETATSSSKLAIWLMTKLANSTYRTELVGDLQEEYSARQSEGVKAADRWLWRQALLAIADGQRARTTHPDFIRFICIVLSLTGMFTLFGFVVWLSNMDGTTDALWQQLLAGNVIQIAVSGDFWREALPQFSAAQIDVFMFIHYPAIAALAVWSTFMYITLRRFSLSTAQTWLIGMIAMSIPYLWGSVYIDMVQPEARQVGPILAFMILTPFYILPALTAITVVKSRKETMTASMNS